MTKYVNLFDSFTIMPSIRRLKDIEFALNSISNAVLLSEVHIGNLRYLTKQCHEKNKIVFVNIDLVGGLSADQIGIKLLKDLFKVDGVVSSNSMSINLAKSIGLHTIQRFFLIDSRGFESGLKALKNTRIDAIEVLPGPLSFEFKDKIEAVREVPIIAGGFIKDKSVIAEAYKAGFIGVTTSEKNLWNDYSYLK
ncbi:MAG: glycerol-3-phosphate responsive antiterminator GlpP [Clostridiaceae bacterium]|nr:glycerol-3-phosphate responsive antiterminator GlpP [Clostridiaceae bacterium]